MSIDKYVVHNAAFYVGDEFFLDCVADWVFVNAKTRKLEPRHVNCLFQTFGVGKHLAYGLRDGVPVTIDLATMQSKAHKVLETEYQIECLKLSSAGDQLHFIASHIERFVRRTIGTISIKNMALESLWHLDEDECCNSIKSTFYGACFLTGNDERVSTTTKLRSTSTGEIVWDSGYNERIPVGNSDRMIQTDFDPDHGVHAILCDYGGREIARERRNSLPCLVRVLASGRFYTVATDDGWSVNSSLDGSVVLKGAEYSRIIVADKSDLIVRLFGVGRRNQCFEIYDLGGEGKTKLVIAGKLMRIYSRAVFSEDLTTLVLFNDLGPLEFEIVSLSS